MALKLETTIRNMDDFTEQGWVSEMGDADDYHALVACEEDELPVEVLCEATDGYYDVKTPSGRVINALSWWHLDGFAMSGPSLFTNLE